jgi:DNA-nicking Smr family endonuclease
MSRDGGKRRGLSRDERALWNAFTKSIKPRRPQAPEIDEEPDAAAPAPKKSAQKKPAASPPPKPVVPPPSPLALLDRRTRQRIARGRAEIEARLDLHGHTQDEAHSALLCFLRSAAARDKRTLLVITGKSGVLRRQVPQWLTLPEFRALVIGFEQAGVRHGGEGALYVRVRRSR